MDWARITSTGQWLLAFAFCAACDLRAAVEWATTSAMARAAAGQEAVELAFAFRNAGPRAARIVRLQPSCDCVSATVAPETVAPGETGKVAVKFALGGRSGRQERTVSVFFSDEPDRPVELRLVVEIPEPMAISPRLVFWRVGEAAEEKAFDIVLAAESDRLGEITCADVGFVVRLEPTSDARRWRALIKPVDTATVRQAVVRLSAAVGGQPRVFVLHAAVK